jgi:hypothetical protein
MVFKPKLLFQTKPVTAPHKALLNIHSNDILSCPISMNLGKDYNESSIVTVITNSGICEILFTKNGELLQRENQRLLSDISTFYEKHFLQGTLDGQPCFIHSNIVNNNN